MLIIDFQHGIPHGSAEEDPWCSATSPHRLNFEDITSAAFKVKNGILVTPCMVSQLHLSHYELDL
jgi:hypothetical protein